MFIFLPSQFSPLYPELQIHFPKVVSHFPLYEQFGSKHKISEFISDLTKILTKYQLILFTFTIFSPVSRIANTLSQGYITFSIIWTIWFRTKDFWIFQWLGTNRLIGMYCKPPKMFIFTFTIFTTVSGVTITWTSRIITKSISRAGWIIT